MTTVCKLEDPLAYVDFLSIEFRDNPYRVYAEMLAEHPIFYSERYRQYFAFSEQAVREVLSGKDFTVESPFRASRILFGPTVVDLDGGDHRRLRIALSDTINARKNQLYREQIIRPIIHRSLDRMGDNCSRDWVADLCDQVPLLIMSKIIGIPEKDFDFFRKVCGPIIKYLDFATVETKKAGTEAMAELKPYLSELLTNLHQGGHFEETIIGSYLEQQQSLGQPSMEEIIRHISLLIPASIDTTNRLMANCVYMLCADKVLQARLRDEPDGIPSFVAEVLRFEPPIHTTLRIAKANTQVLGLDIPMGAAVTVNLAAAGRDPSLYSEPDRFNPLRAPSSRNLSFGAGKHQCLGKNLARLEVFDFIAVLLQTFADVSFDPSVERPRITGTSFRSPRELSIVASKAAITESVVE